MRRGGVNESVVFIEASRLHLRRLFLLVQNIKILVEHHDRSLSDHDKESERLVPLDLFHLGGLGEGHLIEHLASGQIIEEDAVVGVDQDPAKGCRVDHLHLGQALLVDLHLLDVRTVQVADSHLPVHIKDTNLVFRNENGSKGVITSLLKVAAGRLQVLGEFIDDKAARFSIEVQDDIMRILVEVVVIDGLGLVEENLLTVGVHSRHQGLLVG
jgi:hypothetical protein